MRPSCFRVNPTCSRGLSTRRSRLSGQYVWYLCLMCTFQIQICVPVNALFRWRRNYELFLYLFKVGRIMKESKRIFKLRLERTEDNMVGSKSWINWPSNWHHFASLYIDVSSDNPRSMFVGDSVRRSDGFFPVVCWSHEGFERRWMQHPSHSVKKKIRYKSDGGRGMVDSTITWSRCRFSNCCLTEI